MMSVGFGMSGCVASLSRFGHKGPKSLKNGPFCIDKDRIFTRFAARCPHRRTQLGAAGATKTQRDDMLFSDLGLGPEVLKAVADAGYTEPTPIQAQAIPHVLLGRDLLGVAQTGTGKTASFTLPMIEILASGRAKARMPRSLILEPTRELADQVAKNFETYGKYHKLNMALIIGGVSMAEQEKRLDRGVDVLIATPGRLLDLVDRGKVMLTGVRTLVVDEADRMMDMGFIPDVQKIVGLLPPLRQTLFFSATMSTEMRRIADSFLTNPKEVTVARPATTASNVEQGLVMLPAADKREALRRLMRAENVRNAIVFCNRKRDVDILHKSLAKHGFDAAPLHGDLAQSARTETLERFKSGQLAILVASDVAARGLDVQGLSHVFNFDVPIHAEDYVHRIGRTGRAGLSGHAYTLATPAEQKFVTAIEELIGKPIPRVAVEGIGAPSAEEMADGESRGRRGRGRSRAPKAEAAPAIADEADDRTASPAPESRARSGRGRGRREKAPRQPEAEIVTLAVAPPAEAAAEPSRRKRQDRDATRRDRRDEDRRDQNRDQGRDQDRGNGRPVIGFGDHVPAFLMRPVFGG